MLDLSLCMGIQPSNVPPLMSNADGIASGPTSEGSELDRSSQSDLWLRPPRRLIRRILVDEEEEEPIDEYRANAAKAKTNKDGEDNTRPEGWVEGEDCESEEEDSDGEDSDGDEDDGDEDDSDEDSDGDEDDSDEDGGDEDGSDEDDSDEDGKLYHMEADEGDSEGGESTSTIWKETEELYVGSQDCQEVEKATIPALKSRFELGEETDEFAIENLSNKRHKRSHQDLDTSHMSTGEEEKENTPLSTAIPSVRSLAVARELFGDLAMNRDITLLQPDEDPKKRKRKVKSTLTSEQRAKRMADIQAGINARLKQNVFSQLEGEEDAVEIELVKPQEQIHDAFSVFLSEEQRNVLNLVLAGDSMFFTGSAGCGKSVLMRHIIRALKNIHPEEGEVAVCASTGIAACHIGGMTLNKFAGLPSNLRSLGYKDATAQIRKRGKDAIMRLKRVKVLIIDEVSMVDGNTFDFLDDFFKEVRGNPQSFGDVQLVVAGDFFQLPPVPDKNIEDDKKREVSFAFESPSWKKALVKSAVLTRVFRQKDEAFINMLNEIRIGKVSTETKQMLYSLRRPVKVKGRVEPTELFATKRQVEFANNSRLQKLTDAHPRSYRAEDNGNMEVYKSPEQLKSTLDNASIVPDQVNIAIGAQVMLVKNLDDDHVNGSVGTVIRFSNRYTRVDEHGNREKVTMRGTEMYPVVEFTNPRSGAVTNLLITRANFEIRSSKGEVIASRSQVPLILAWAMSIHKAQGQTIDYLKIDMKNIFEKGQAYVALSRATCLEGLQVLNFNSSKVFAHAKVIKWYHTIQNATLKN